MFRHKTSTGLAGFVPIILALSAINGGTVPAQVPIEPSPGVGVAVPAASNVTIDEVQARLKKVEENAELEAAIKSKLIEVLTKALESLRGAADASARSEQYAKLIREAPETLQTLKSELAKPLSEQPPTIPADATFAQVQQNLSHTEMKLSEAQKSLQSLQDEPKRRADRRLEIPKRADAIKLQLQEFDKSLEIKPSPDEPIEVTSASRLLIESRKKELQAEFDANQAELQLFETTGELLAAQRDWAARQTVELDNQVKVIRAVVNERRRQEVDRQADDALKISAQANPAVREVAEANAVLAKLRQSLAEKIEGAALELEQIDGEETALKAQFKKITKRFETAGGTEAIGLMLRKQRSELLNAAAHQRKIKQRSAEITDMYLELIEYEEQRNELATLGQRVKKITAGLDGGTSDLVRRFLELEVRHVLESQRDLYDSLIADSNGYLETLSELNLREGQLADTTEAFAKYCDERILWIRSATVLNSNDLQQLGSSLRWLTDPNGWKEIVDAFWIDAKMHPLHTASALAAGLLLLFMQRRLRAVTTQLGEQASRSNIVSYLPTFRTMVTTSLLALLWPGTAAYLGWRLLSSETGSDFVHAIGHGLSAAALVFATLELLRQIYRKHGLSEAHFDWDPTAIRSVRDNLRWFMLCGLPLLFITETVEAQSSEIIKSSLGRLAFVGLLFVLGVCVHRVMRPIGGALDRVYAAAPQAWASRLQRTWHLLALSAPITLGLLALAGYYYTALQLAWRLLATWWLVIGSFIAYSALLRWSLLSYRDLAMRKARERRAATEAAAANPTVAAPPSAVVAINQPEVKLSDINKQTRKALKLALAVALLVGVWLVWSDILPALRALDGVTLWTVESVGADLKTDLQPITLADVLSAILIASLTVAASRNLPSLLEIALLQRLPLDPGVRYAVTTVCKYLITAVGIVAAFGVVGIGWSKVQWLVAAISVGLGFGLQEIFANFVSGLILLFERPVRLGDIVTVGDVSGHVTRIQMRATTITDWDMRELVVPNKEFITGRLMNWTLSSTISRMSIEVGVAYGTDPDLVRSILLGIATRHPLVLKEPEPHALFDEFSESTLNFVLRLYMASRDVYLQIRHEVLTEIDRDFRQAGIEIAFPQRDLHIRSTVPSPNGSTNSCPEVALSDGSEQYDGADAKHAFPKKQSG